MILLALLITSFPTLVRLLHMRFWKQLQQLVYIAVLFLFQPLMHAPPRAPLAERCSTLARIVNSTYSIHS